MLFGKTYVRIFVFKMLITHRTIGIGNRRAANFLLFNYVDSVRLQEPSTKVTQFGSFLQHKRPIYLSHLHWPLMTIQMSLSQQCQIKEIKGKPAGNSGNLCSRGNQERTISSFDREEPNEMCT